MLRSLPITLTRRLPYQTVPDFRLRLLTELRFSADVGILIRVIFPLPIRMPPLIQREPRIISFGEIIHQMARVLQRQLHTFTGLKDITISPIRLFSPVGVRLPIITWFMWEETHPPFRSRVQDQIHAYQVRTLFPLVLRIPLRRVQLFKSFTMMEHQQPF